MTGQLAVFSACLFMADYGLTCAWLVSVRGLRVLQTRDISNIHLINLQHSQAPTMLNG
jgi:hypothetical protein